MSDELAQLDASELERRIAEIRERMRPLEQNLSAMRGERDVLLTELRRRRRLAERTTRADLKAAMREGNFPTVAELVAGSGSGALDGFVCYLKTAGRTRAWVPW